MNKRGLKIILLAVCLAALVGVYFLVTRTGDGVGEETTAAPTVTHVVSKIDLNTVYQFGYTYEGKEYNFRLNENGDAWVWDENSSLPISNTKVALMLTYFAEMTSTVQIDEVTSEKYTEYGFDSPALQMHFTDGNGIHSFRVGIVNPYNSLVYIISESDTSTAFMVASEFTDEFSCGIDEMLQVEENLLPSLSNDITLTFENGSEKLVYSFYPSGKSNYISGNCKWFLSINGGEEFPINETVGTDLNSALKSLLFAEIVTYDEDKYHEYGLGEKKNKVTLSGTQVSVSTDSSTGEQTETKTPFTFEFYLGKSDDDGFSYAMTDNSPLLYVTSSSVFEELYSFDRNNLASIRSAYIWNIDPAEIAEATVNCGGKDYTFKISETSSNLTCTLNGKPVSYDSAKPLIEALAMLEWDNDVSKVTENAKDKNELLSIDVSDGTLSASASFFGYSDEYCRIVHADRNEFLMLRSNLDSIIKLLTDLTK